ncbi:MAG: hypothetical protein ACAI25_14780 [Planctomycetota bacterium]
MSDSNLTSNKGTKLFATDNMVSVTKGDDKSWGICGSMSARWIQEGLKKNAPIVKSGDMPSTHNIAITQGAWTINASKDNASMGKWLLDTFNLKSGTIKVGKIESWRTVAGVAQTTPGYLLFTVKGGTAKAGHAMAFHIGGQGQKSYYLDPNVGVYSFANAADCALAVANHMKTHYDNYKNGEYKLYPTTED